MSIETSKTFQAAMMAADVASRGLSTRERLIVQITASRINGCTYCIDMHTEEAEDEGIDIAPVDAREELIVRFTEMGTRLADGADDAPIDEALSVLGEEDTANLIAAVAVINAWNRVGRLAGGGSSC